MDNKPTILIVEDQPLLRALLVETMEDDGYVVLESGAGEDAIATLATADIAAIVTDIRLGIGPSGWEVARFARRQHPRMAVIYMSGDSASDWATEGVPASVMVRKPFAIAQMITTVSNLMNIVDLKPRLAQTV